jgi:hypothetical protein
MAIVAGLPSCVSRIFLCGCALSLFVNAAANGDLRAGTHASAISRDLVNRGFEELAPVVTDVVVKKGDPFVEVFITGYVNEDFCFEKKEYAVEGDANETRIIVRFRKSSGGPACKGGRKFFSDKAADLDPNSPAAKIVKVLGYYGWQEARLSENVPETAAPPGQ